MSAYKKCILYLFLVVFLLYGSALAVFQLFRQQNHVEIQNRIFENTEIIATQIDGSLTVTVSQLLQQLDQLAQTGKKDQILDEIRYLLSATSYFSGARLQTDDGSVLQISRLGAAVESLSSPLPLDPKRYLIRVDGQLALNLTSKDGACRMIVSVDSAAVLQDMTRSVKMENAVLLPSDGLGPIPYRNNNTQLIDLVYGGSEHFQHKRVESLEVAGEKRIVIYMPLHTLSASVGAVFDSSKVFAGDTLWNNIILGVSLLALICFAFGGVVLHEVIHRPLHRLVDAFADLDKGNLNVKIDTNHRDEFQYIFQSFNQMTEGLKNSIDINYRQVIRTQQAELKQLHLQVNPHFLYNCFSNIHSLCTCGDYALIRTFVRRLSSYYRYITYDSGLDTSFENEYIHALDYIAIQEIRFGGRISAQATSLEQLESIWDIRVPKLLLQPLIENSYKHALESIPKGGRLELTVSLTEGRLELRVEDNGQGLEDNRLLQLDRRMRGEENADSIGLENVYRRLKLYYKGRASMALSRSALGGLAVTIQIEEEKPC